MPELTYGQAVNQALRGAMAQDPRVVLLGEDVAVQGGIFGVTQGLLEEFGPKRVRDTPISEAAFVGLAVGAAMTGLRPVVEIMFMDFMLVAADQVVNQAAKMRYMTGGQVQVPLVIRTQQGGGRGGGAQHSQSFDALFAHIPGLKVALPSTPADAYGLLLSSLADPNPVIFIEHKLLYATRGEVTLGQAVPLGRAAVKRQGDHVTVVAVSRAVHWALEAAEALAAEGISVEVIDPRTVRPLDLQTVLASVRRTNRLVLVHEAASFGSVLAELAAQVQERAFDDLDAPILRVSGPDAPLAASKPLEDAQLPSPARIIAAIRAVL
jgi:acetoin:2,6-dichlorophenolindophenol oxidoreductase subunit beta